MNLKIYPSLLSGRVRIPPGKSEAQRMVAMATLCEGVSYIHNFPINEDSAAALRCSLALGAEVRVSDSICVVKGNPSESIQKLGEHVELDCGESGLCARLFACLASLCDSEIVVKGRGSLMKRPFDTFHSVFDALEVDFVSDSGRLPLTIRGPMNQKDVVVDGSVSSQFISGLLIALSAAPAKRQVVVNSPTSMPYILLTLNLLQEFGVSWSHSQHGVFDKVSGCLSATRINVPSDWSAAASLMIAAALCADKELELLGLDKNSYHADTAVLNLLLAADIPTRWNLDASGVFVSRSKPRAFEFDFGNCPDLVPVAMVLAAASTGECRLFNTARLRFKESDRGLAMQQEFGKAGIKVRLSENEIIVEPGIGERAHFSSHGDHRVAMAMALFAMANQGGSLDSADCVAKSYSHFFDDLASLGARWLFAS